MARLTQIGEIRVFEDRALMKRMVADSGIVCAAGVVVGVLWYGGVSAFAARHGAKLVPFELDAIARSPVAWCLSLIAAMAVSFVVHELVHGFFFKQFAPPGSRVGYGADLKHGMLYAMAEGIVYAREHYLIIIMAPTIVVTVVLLAVGVGIRWPLWTIILVTAHLSGCTGDWEYARVLRHRPEVSFCEDTSWGVRLFAVQDEVQGRGASAMSEPVMAAGAARPAFVVVDGGRARWETGPAGDAHGAHGALADAPETAATTQLGADMAGTAPIVEGAAGELGDREGSCKTGTSAGCGADAEGA